MALTAARLVALCCSVVWVLALLAAPARAGYGLPYDCTICQRALPAIRSLGGAQAGADAVIKAACPADPLSFSTDSTVNVCVVFAQGKCLRYLSDPGAGWTGALDNPFDPPLRTRDRTPMSIVFGSAAANGQGIRAPKVPPRPVLPDRHCEGTVRDMLQATNLAEVVAGCGVDTRACCQKLSRKLPVSRDAVVPVPFFCSVDNGRRIDEDGKPKPFSGAGAFAGAGGPGGDDGRLRMANWVPVGEPGTEKMDQTRVENEEEATKNMDALSSGSLSKFNGDGGNEPITDEDE